MRLRSRCDSHLPTLMVTVLSSNRLFVISLVVFLACHASLAWTICVSNNNTAKFPELENRSKIHLMQHMSYPYVLYSLTFFIRRLLLPSISLQVETRLRQPNSYEMCCKKPDRSTAQGNAIAPFLSSFLNI